MYVPPVVGVIFPAPERIICPAETYVFGVKDSPPMVTVPPTPDCVIGWVTNTLFVPIFWKYPVPVTVDEMAPSKMISPAPATGSVAPLERRAIPPYPAGLRLPTVVFAVSCSAPLSVAEDVLLKFTSAPSVLPYPFPATPTPPNQRVSAVEKPFRSTAAPLVTIVPAAPPDAPKAPTLPTRKMPAVTEINPVKLAELSAPKVNVFGESLIKPGLAESEIAPFRTISPYPAIRVPRVHPSTAVAPAPPPPVSVTVTGPVYPLPGFVMAIPVTNPPATVATADAPLPPPPEIVTVGAVEYPTPGFATPIEAN